MTIPIPKYVALAIIASFFFVEHGLSQCQPQLNYTVEKKSDGSYSVYLKPESTLTSLKIQIYDLLQGKVLEERNISQLEVADQEIFKNVPPSKYAILITVANCDKPKTLGGISGINIGIQD